MKIALAESTSPSAATKEQSADAVAVVSNVSLTGFRVSSTETAVATVLCPVVRPIASVVNMSKQAPNFSARVIGSNRSPDETELVPPESTDGAEVAPPVSATPLSKKDRLRARKVNAATSTIPTPVIHTAIGYAFQ